MELAEFLPLFLGLSGLGLVVALCSEQSQIVFKVMSANRGHIAAGYNAAMKIMLLNRFGTILYMFLLSLTIDIGITNGRILGVAIGSAALVLLFNVVLMAFRHRIFSVSKIDARRESLVFFLKERGWLLSFAIFVATTMHVLGLTIPLLLSNSIPEYRLSMAQTGFLLNVVFTLINVLFIEQKVATILDTGNTEDAYIFASKIFVARTLAVAFACSIFFGLLLIL